MGFLILVRHLYVESGPWAQFNMGNPIIDVRQYYGHLINKIGFTILINALGPFQNDLSCEKGDMD